MTALQHRRRIKINLHYGNRLKYSNPNEDGLRKTVQWRRENNECWEVKTMLSGSPWINTENERKKKNAWNLKTCARF